MTTQASSIMNSDKKKRIINPPSRSTGDEEGITSSFANNNNGHKAPKLDSRPEATIERQKSPLVGKGPAIQLKGQVPVRSSPTTPSQAPSRSPLSGLSQTNSTSQSANGKPVSTVAASAKQSYFKDELPVIAHRSEFKAKCASNAHAVVLVVGETGSGKTTKLPQYLLDDSNARRVCVTQPRRVAATTLARRVAFERKCELGKEVGYRVRFDDKTDPSRTRLVFLTDGLLLREAMRDPLLRAYDWIVLDEAHERSLNTDVLFGVIKRALKLRNTNNRISLRVVVMSATIDVDLFQRYFDACVMTVEGRQHPVEVWYLPEPQDDRNEACCKAVLQIHEDEPLPGDVLVFLSGKEEIDAVCRALQKAKLDLIVCPLHASLPAHVQMKAFERAPQGYRKVVVATNVAETSVTVDGVRFVVDAGVAKVKRRDKSSGVKKLAVMPISKSQAWQRCGRAGREAPGKCYRLYTESTFEQMREDPEPEILRVDLAEVVMQLLALGVKDINSFDFLQRPDTRALTAALSELSSFGAIAMVNKELVLTEKGKRMSALPVEPMHANLLLKAVEMNCVNEIAGIVAMGGGVESPFYGQGDEANAARRKWTNAYGDHLTSLAVLDAYKEELERGNKKQFARDNYVREEVLHQAVQARKQLVDICKEFSPVPIASDQDIVVADGATVKKCLACGMSTHVAKRIGKSEYEPVFNPRMTVSGSQSIKAHATSSAFLHPSSTLSMIGVRPEYVVYDEILVTSKTYLRGVSAVEDPVWLMEDQPEVFRHEPVQPAVEKKVQERKEKKMGRAFAID